MASVDRTSTHPVEWEDEAAADGLPPPGSGHASSAGTPTAIKASILSTGASFAAAPGGGHDGPGSAQPSGRAPSLRQAASFLRSSFSASTRFLGRMASSNDPASRPAAGGAGLPPSGGKGPRDSFIGSLLNAVGLGGGDGHGHGHASGFAGSVSPSSCSRSGPNVTGRSKLMTSPSRNLARLSSAAMMRGEIQNFSQFGDLRNDSFSKASTARLRRRSSHTGGAGAGAAEEVLAAADAAAAGGSGGPAGLFRKLGSSISLLRQSAPAPLSYSSSVQASGSGLVHNGEHAGTASGTPRDKHGDSRHGSPASAARLARPSEGYSNPLHQPPRYSHSGGPGLGGDISLASVSSFGRFHSPAHMRPHAPSQLSRTTGASASPPSSRPATRGGHDGSSGVSPPCAASGAGHGYVAEAGGGGAPPPGALSRSGSLALRERPPTPKGRSPRSSVNGSPGRLGKVLGSFRLPDILAAGGSGRSVTERRNSGSGSTGGAVNSFTRPSGSIDTSTSGATGPAAAAVAVARQHRLSSGGAGAVVRGSGGSMTGGGVAAMGPGGAAICAAAAKRAAALAAASGGNHTPTGAGPGSAGPGGGGSGGTPLVVAASGAPVTGGAPRASGAPVSGKGPGLLGGILKDFQTSMELDEEGAMAAVEAEFDRRFGNGGRATPAPHSGRSSPTLALPGSRPQSGRHSHHLSVSALPPRSQSPHPPALPPVPGPGAAPAGPDRGTPGQQPFVRRRNTLGDGRPASPLQMRSAAPVMDGHGGGAGGGAGLESILSTSFDNVGDAGSFMGSRPRSASQQSPGSPPQSLNARMRLASIRMSFAEGIVAAAPPGPGGGGAGVIRGGPAPAVVPGLVSSPSVSQGGMPPLPSGVPGQLPQQASPVMPAARPPSSSGGGSSARGRSASGVSRDEAGLSGHH
ncbi:hypothetical protein HYH02_005048 [Chlamydomonas schloesseri]|uniref:Uncharacterized protein n=1 Tax=Chlamydomonas schloesseri TaxID=2026947 RepID=A0A836B854_9CHLO|nr:hypothetical protein HYH02_005048 [Chlamydomonas schloesseri]|eukprot:KAG2450547.1 hypothetical protein HYH02_005048 [Chlamydomonas schloesseri]